MNNLLLHSVACRALLTIALVSLAAFTPGTLAAGRIVVAHDDLVLADGGFHAPSDPGTFAKNVAAWFTGGRAGRFLAYSDNQGVTGTLLIGAMTSAGHTWVVSTTTPLTLSNLLNFDGVFLCGRPIADSGLLRDYVYAGGSVYVAAEGVPSVDMANWNHFLGLFGLAFTNRTTGVADYSTPSAHAIFAGVDHLYAANGTSVVDLQPGSSINRMLVSSGGLGLFAVWGLDKNQLVIRVSQVEVCWNSETNVIYGLEYRSELTSNSWLPLGTNCYTGDGSIKCVYDSVPFGEPKADQSPSLPATPFRLNRDSWPVECVSSWNKTE